MRQVSLKYYGKRWKMNNPGEGRVGFHYNKGAVYERQLLVDIYQQNLTGAAFDIGAHIGNHALWFSVVCGLRTYAWEPHDASRAQLLANIALNRAPIEVYDWGAADRSTTARFTPGFWLEFDPAREGAAMEMDHGEVKVHRIDDMLDVPDLALVKIDIEGMEAHALRGLVRHLRRSHPLVYCEAHTDDDIRAQGAVVEPLGYRLTRTIHMGSRVVRWSV